MIGDCHALTSRFVRMARIGSAPDIIPDGRRSCLSYQRWRSCAAGCSAVSLAG
ncbi:hypothetical protein FRAAL5803 [Frankia alni ACN14a]|uniref:Uncharacterized protein n=1 Tax=Frankia alni (strain DSM 45986 / CECT 9034 / ACN14a) TaxID=326424 RepID=Q0RDN1_FRAAA|nr:hypothetical protein FRAAL5803 [Frankia alni ACN14a]